MTFPHSLDSKLIEQIDKLIFEETTDPDKTLEVLQEMLTVRGILYEQKKEDETKAKHSYLPRLKSIAGNSFQRIASVFTHHNHNNSEIAYSASREANSKIMKNYLEEEQKKTWSALERIYKKEIISPDEAKRIFNKIYNSDPERFKNP